MYKFIIKIDVNMNDCGEDSVMPSMLKKMLVEKFIILFV